MKKPYPVSIMAMSPIKTHFHVFRWIASDLCQNLNRKLCAIVLLKQDPLS